MEVKLHTHSYLKHYLEVSSQFQALELFFQGKVSGIYRIGGRVGPEPVFMIQKDKNCPPPGNESWSSKPWLVSFLTE